MVYTGIGARKTPEHIKKVMSDVSAYLYLHNPVKYTLRSGKAAGADEAFQLGVQSTMMGTKDKSACEIYIPWKKFKSSERLWDCWDISDWPEDECMYVASQVHPAWNRCTSAAKRLHARNVCQILGKDLNTPSDFVLFWAEEISGKVKGGTATAVNLARQNSIPTINMYFDNWKDKLRETVGVNK